MDQSFVKPPGLFLPTPWHQDNCYYNIGGHDLIRAWLCCDPVPRHVSLEVVRGSHPWNVTYSPLAGRNPENDPSAQAQLEGARAGEPMLGADVYATGPTGAGSRTGHCPRFPTSRRNATPSRSSAGTTSQAT